MTKFEQHQDIYSIFLLIGEAANKQTLRKCLSQCNSIHTIPAGQHHTQSQIESQTTANGNGNEWMETDN